MTNTLFSIAYIAIIAAVGINDGEKAVWALCAVTMALAFFSHEVATFLSARLANVLVVLSWLTAAAAGFFALM